MGKSPVGSGKVGDVRRGQLVNTDLADGQPYLVSLPCGPPLVVQKRSCIQIFPLYSGNRLAFWDSPKFWLQGRRYSTDIPNMVVIFMLMVILYI